MCVAYYPGTATPDFLLPEDADEQERQAARLLDRLSPNFPPTLLFHGVEDAVVPLSNSQSFFERLRDIGVPVELHAFEGQDHLFDRNPAYARVCAELADIFCQRHLGGRGEGPG